jgi:hypothetical protein
LLLVGTDKFVIFTMTSFDRDDLFLGPLKDSYELFTELGCIINAPDQKDLLMTLDEINRGSYCSRIISTYVRAILKEIVHDCVLLIYSMSHVRTKLRSIILYHYIIICPIKKVW